MNKIIFGSAILSFFLILFGRPGWSQNIGINSTGATPDVSAMLDIDVSALAANNKKGLLIPRVALTAANDGNTIPNPATSLLVYSDGTGGLAPAGYYYNSGTTGSPNWVQLGSSSAWLLTGNAGTADGINFIGTTDNVPFNIRVNDQKAGRVASNGPVFFGYQAGNSNTAVGSTGIGYQSLFSNTTGAGNTATGFQALYFNTSGNQNTAIGQIALFSNINGGQNVAIGQSALLSNINGSQNTATGMNALHENTLGIQNTANGYQALYSNTTAGQNTATGMNALYSNSTGNENSAMGFGALYTNTIGAGNTASGVYALASNTNGNENTAIGCLSLFNSRTGACNTVVGYGAGLGVTTNSYSNNSLFGYKAGYGLTTGSNNVFIGYQAGSGVTTSSNLLYIDNSNTPTPLIYGDFSSDRVGINDNAPSATLDVEGTTKLGVNGTVLTKVIKATVNLDPPMILANSTSAITVAVANAVTTSSVVVSPSSALGAGAGIAYARVSSAGTVEITFMNTNALAADPSAAQDFYITIIE